MKKNNKGFMLAEVIVTSTIVVTSMVALYVSVSKIYNNYREKANYYNLDAVYATKTTINSMINNEYINNFISSNFYNKNYGYFIKDNVCESSDTSCPALKDLYKVKNMVLVEYDKTALENFKNVSSLLNETLKDYIDYLINYYNIQEENDDYNYIVITEIEEKDNNYYANLRVR